MFIQLNENWVVNTDKICDFGMKSNNVGEPCIEITWISGSINTYRFPSVEARDKRFKEIKELLFNQYAFRGGCIE